LTKKAARVCVDAAHLRDAKETGLLKHGFSSLSSVYLYVRRSFSLTICLTICPFISVLFNAPPDCHLLPASRF